MSEYIHKSYSVTVLQYHTVFPAKYGRAVIDKNVDKKIKEACLAFEKRYEIKFLAIGTDNDHMHFIVQSVPSNSITMIVTKIKSLKAREDIKKCPDIKKQL